MILRLRQAGFTLIETVLALAVVGLVAVAVLGQVAAGTRATADAAGTLTALTLAEATLASTQLLDASTLLAMPDSLRAGDYAPPLDDYGWTLSAERAPDDPLLVDIAASTEWSGGSVTLRTRRYLP